jgi:isopenicillin N synthase-like dioxygenase
MTLNVNSIHHVVPNVSGSSRYSMVFFTGPSTDTVVAPLDTCVNEDTPSKYAPIIAGEHLKQRLDASNNKITV